MFQQKFVKFNLVPISYNSFRCMTQSNNCPPSYNYLKPINYIVIGGIALYSLIKYRYSTQKKVLKEDSQHDEFTRLFTREKMFLKFASVEYAGQIFMTPLDFLESIVDTNPRKRIKRKVLTTKWISDMQEDTRQNENKFLARGHNGIISYVEYMFLLSLISKPIHSFKIAFDMFDQDKSGSFTKETFLNIEKIIRRVWKGRRLVKKKKVCETSDVAKLYFDCPGSEEKGDTVATTLYVLLFGNEERSDLSFKHFSEFVLNMQTEIIEYEFHQMSQGGNFLSADDFAHILLKYSYKTADAMQKYEEIYQPHLPVLKKGIPLKDFALFCMFLHNIEDFQIAMRYYTTYNVKTSKEDLMHAVYIATGSYISANIIDIIFAIFDINHDGYLDRAEYRHFIAVMKDRIYRGFRSYIKTGFSAFKSCLRDEIANNSKLLFE